MSRKQQKPNQAPAAEKSAPKEVEEWRRCPICWGGRGGVGHHNGQYEGKGTHYLKCNRCSHTWSIEARFVVTKINHNLPEPDDAAHAAVDFDAVTVDDGEKFPPAEIVSSGNPGPELSPDDARSPAE